LFSSGQSVLDAPHLRNGRFAPSFFFFPPPPVSGTRFSFFSIARIVGLSHPSPLPCSFLRSLRHLRRCPRCPFVIVVPPAFPPLCFMNLSVSLHHEHFLLTDLGPVRDQLIADLRLPPPPFPPFAGPLIPDAVALVSVLPVRSSFIFRRSPPFRSDFRVSVSACVSWFPFPTTDPVIFSLSLVWLTWCTISPWAASCALQSLFFSLSLFHPAQLSCRLLKGPFLSFFSL